MVAHNSVRPVPVVNNQRGVAPEMNAGESHPDHLPKQIITIAVVDDDVNVRKGLWWLLSNIVGLHCIGTYANFHEARHGLKLQAPDIVLLDVSMPGVSGLEAIRPLRKDLPQVKIIMHSNYDDEEKISLAKKAGAAGYVLKNASAPALYEAILKVHQGASVWPAGYSEADLRASSPSSLIGRMTTKAFACLRRVRRR